MRRWNLDRLLRRTLGERIHTLEEKGERVFWYNPMEVEGGEVNSAGLVTRRVAIEDLPLSSASLQLKNEQSDFWH